MDVAAVNKLRNKPTVLDGYRFASMKEAKRYGELKLLLAADRITDLIVQPVYKIEINGELVCKYVADFTYLQRINAAGLVEVVEDVKGRKAGVQYQMFRLKAKLMKAILGIEVREV